MTVKTFQEPVRSCRSVRQRPMEHGIRVLVMLAVLAAFLGTPAFAADAPVVIKLWNVYVGQKKFYQQIFKDFNKANPDIKVEYTLQMSWEAWTKAIDDAFRAGDPPDLFIAPVPFGEAAYPGSVPKAVEQGWLTPLDSIAPSKQALATWMAKFPQEKQPFVESMNVFSGKVYSWPNSFEILFGCLLYNARLFRDAGLQGSDGKSTAPETWDDLRLFAKKVTQMGQGKVFGMAVGKDLDGVWPLAASAGWSDLGFNYWGFGFNWRTGRHDFASPNLKGSLQLMIDMKKDGSVFPGSQSLEYNDTLAKFSKGLAGMTFLTYKTSVLDDSLDGLDVVSPPTPKKGQVVGGQHITPFAAFGGYVVSNKVKNKEAAIWKVMQFMTSQEYQESWVKAVAGQGFLNFSIFPQYNKPELFPYPFYAKLSDLAHQLKVGPDLPIGSDIVASHFAPGNPGWGEAVIGIYNAQFGWEALDELNVRFDAAFDKALVDAKKDGVNLTRADFTRPDWDPGKDYVPKKK